LTLSVELASRIKRKGMSRQHGSPPQQRYDCVRNIFALSDHRITPHEGKVYRVFPEIAAAQIFGGRAFLSSPPDILIGDKIVAVGKSKAYS
jgi:hypothetical protein